jgi:hypothetical protein
LHNQGKKIISYCDHYTLKNVGVGAVGKKYHKRTHSEQNLMDADENPHF